MLDAQFTRRDTLKTAAMLGVVALAGKTKGQEQHNNPPKGYATIGIQSGPPPLATGDIDKVLETMRTRGGVNTLFPFIFTNVSSMAGMPAAGFGGGNFAMPHMEYYKNTSLKFEDMRAPDYGDLDLFARIIPAAKKQGMKTFAWILEDNRRPTRPAWNDLYEIDFHGRRADAHPAGPCYNNPLYRGFVLGLVEDYLRSYELDGLMWSSERQGGFFNALGAYHNGQASDPGKATCFCEFCVKRAKSIGIDVERARAGFTALEQFVRAGRARQKPRDGYFVSFFRVLLQYPELLAWEKLWIDSRMDLMGDIYKLAKSIKPANPVGWHIWHNVSFSPFHRAEMDYAKIAEISDFIKPVLYSNCAGERMRSFVNSVGQNVFGDLPPAQAMDVLYQQLDYSEAPYAKVAQTGFSPEYVLRETRRALDDVKGTDVQGKNVEIWPGIDIDVPVGAGASRCTPEYVKQTVLSAFKAGATGVVLSRNYVEMDLEHLSGAGAALDELKLR
jgi:hypothetical protein